MERTGLHRLTGTATTLQLSPATGLIWHKVPPVQLELAWQPHADVSAESALVYCHSVPLQEKCQNIQNRAKLLVCTGTSLNRGELSTFVGLAYIYQQRLCS
jgi:hypothetical protein